MSKSCGKSNMQMPLPISREEMRRAGYEQADIIIVTGDAYVDHPAWGASLIGRLLQSNGYKVAILSQPDFRSVDHFVSLGAPRLFWAVTSGCIDSRLNMYASLGHKRKDDPYSPGGKAGLRPSKPLITYTARCKQANNQVPVILGGLEASLRRLVHYDYIEDRMKPSVLVESKADMLIYGMAEKSILQLAQRLSQGDDIRTITDVPGTVYRLLKDVARPNDAYRIASYSQQCEDCSQVMQAQLEYQARTSPGEKPVIQEQKQLDIVLNAPARPLSTEQMDQLYKLPFTRKSHPVYEKETVPALEPVQWSIVTHRGCFGGCSFCSIYFHQQKQIASRSIDSIVKEAESLIKHPEFKGTISDVGGPTANMFQMKCENAFKCKKASCLSPVICPNLKTDHKQVIELLSALKKFKKEHNVNIFVASGVRHDLALKSPGYIELLVSDFVGGHLKLAPEHFDSNVLKLMNKCRIEEFEKFEKIFNAVNKKVNKQQYIVPYFISSHPGSGFEESMSLTEYLVKRNLRPRQVQDFIPVPLSLSTAMYVSEEDTEGCRVYVPKGNREKRLQLALLHWFMKKNQRQINELLGRKGKNKLIREIKKRIR